MSLAIRKATFFIADFEIQYDWYCEKGGYELADRYKVAVDETLQLLSDPARGVKELFH